MVRTIFEQVGLSGSMISPFWCRVSGILWNDERELTALIYRYNITAVNPPLQLRRTNMRRIIRSMLGVALVLLIASCATAPLLETNKNSAYNEPITKLFVIVATGEWKYTYNTTPNKAYATWSEVVLSDYLVENAGKKFEQSGIDVKIDKVARLELGSERLSKEISDFGTAWVMNIMLSAVYVNGYGQPVQCVYDVAVLDESKQYDTDYPVVWRAKITTAYLRGLDPDNTIDSILSGLIKDGLIAAPTPPKST
jgi:hypothetical protein